MPGEPQLSRAAFLQAGGKSSRMGENKAFVDLDGRTLLARALHTLGEVCDEVVIVGDQLVFSGYGPTISDVFPQCGPLGGIHTALVHTSAELNLMLAVDMPFVSAELVRLIFQRAAESMAIVTVPRVSRGFQPLCAVYRRAFAPIAEKALKAGNYKIDAAFSGIRICEIADPDLRAAGFSERNFFNVNTPEDRSAAIDLKP